MLSGSCRSGWGDDSFQNTLLDKRYTGTVLPPYSLKSSSARTVCLAGKDLRALATREEGVATFRSKNLKGKESC